MKLTQWLAQQRVSARTLARILGVSPSTITRILSGQTPTLETAALIEEVTEGAVSFRDLLPEPHTPEKENL